MSSRGFSRGGTAVAVLLILFLAVVPSTLGVPSKQFPEEPTVTAAGKTIDRAALGANVQPRLSGLVNNEVVVNFVGNGELLTCSQSRLRYTIDGTAPGGSSPRVNADVAPSSCSAPAGAGLEYHFVFVPGNF